MKERPILCSAPMVRAVLSGTKTQTRRIANKPVRHPDLGNLYTPGALVLEGGPQHVIERACPYGAPGDRLWVRESWAAPHAFDHLPPRLIPADARYHYAATESLGGLLGRPSIHMPRWASRIQLEIVSVRVERLQDISEADALAEGIVPVRGGWGLPDGEHFSSDSPVQSFLSLWRSINGDGAVEANPFVWVMEFKRVEGQP